MNTRKLTITIGIPVYNEEQNIVSLLELIEAQNKNNYQINKIIVVNDGSSDNTESKIQEFIYKTDLAIQLVNLDENKGKANALNIIYESADGDLLVTFDSDVRFTSKDSLTHWIYPFIDRKNDVGLVCCRAKVINKNSILSRVFNFSNSCISAMVAFIPEHPTIVNGYVQIIPKNVYEQLRYSVGSSRVDAFAYLWIKSQGLKFISISEPALDELVPEDKGFRWYLRMQNRVTKIPEEHYQVFGREMVNGLYKNPAPSILLIILLRTFIKFPIDGFLYFTWKSLAMVFTKFSRTKIPANWRA